MLDIKPLQRKFLPQDFKVTTWEALEPYYKDLAERPVETLEDYQKFIDDENELDIVTDTDEGWRYVRNSQNVNDEEATAAFKVFSHKIDPGREPYMNTINRRKTESPFAKQVEIPGFNLVLKSVEASNKVFREENIPLNKELSDVVQEFGKIRGSMKVKIGNKEMTMPQAADLQFLTDRAIRQESWEIMQERRLRDRTKIDELMDHATALRTQIANNAGFDNFRDYLFLANAREFTVEDCYDFHESVKEVVMPFNTKAMQDRKSDMGLEMLRPWDLAVDQKGNPPVKAFTSMDDLIKKTQKSFDNVDPDFGAACATMVDRKHLDLISRDGKRPGGYNLHFYDLGLSFIFANLTENIRDVVTLDHEFGHMFHGLYASRNVEKKRCRQTPSEVSELASMTMELVMMDQWDLYLENEEDCVRAKKGFLEETVGRLSWISQVDAFQHSLYTSENKAAERTKIWTEQNNQYKTGTINWSGHEDVHASLWQRQPHITDMPFYYIQYGFAQVGALQIWKNYREDPKQAMAMYKKALSLGHTKTVPEIYETAGIKFDFSTNMMKDVMSFAQKESNKLTL